MKIVNYQINKLNKAEYNPRDLTKKQFEDLKNSIAKFGIVDPILINVNEKRKNIVIGGHQRIEVCKHLNIQEVPCVELNLNEEEEKELNIRLNKNQGMWNFDMLANYFNPDDLIDFGFNLKEINFVLPEINEIKQDIDIKFDEEADDYMPSQVRMVQLFLNTENEPIFKEMLEKLLKEYKTNNITETIYKAVENEYNRS